MQTLLLDIGNSRIKAAIIVDNDLSKLNTELIGTCVITDVLGKFIDGRIKTAIIALSNRQISSRQLESFFQIKSIECQIVKSTSAFGQLKNGYKNPAQLGVDRWLSIIYAWEKSQSSCCVIDCGTCMTFDVVDKSGQHKGGLIMPGLNYSKESLNKLLDVTTQDNSPQEMFFMRNTADAVQGGLQQSFLGAIKRLIKIYRYNFNNDNVFLTGGDAQYAASMLDLEVTIEREMVLRGLFLVAECGILECKEYKT